MGNLKTNTPTSKKMKKAIGYARVSSKKQESEGNSIPVQKEFIEDYASRNDFFLIETLEESKSASLFNKSSPTKLLKYRPVFSDILDRAKQHEFTELVLFHRDRLSRDFYEEITIKTILYANKITIHYASTSETSSDKQNYQDKFIDLVFSSVSMLQAGLIGERAKLGQMQNTKAGFHAGGPVPYGYNLEAHNLLKRKKIFIKDTTEEILISRIFALYNLRFSYVEITKILKKEFPCESKSFAKSTLSQILNNEIYTGSLIWNRNSNHLLGEYDTTVSSAPSKSIEIIPPELFNKVHDIKISKKGINNLCYSSRFLLKGKLICEYCKNPLKSKNSGKGKTSVYYCSCEDENSAEKKIKKWTISIPQLKIEKYIFDILYTNLLNISKDTNLIQEHYLMYQSILEKEKTNGLTLLDNVKDELNEIEVNIDNANEFLAKKFSLQNESKDLYSDIFFESIINAISLMNIRKKELLKQNVETKKAIKFTVKTYEEFKIAFETIFTTLSDINYLKTNDSSPSDLKLKRTIIEELIDKITVNQGINGETLSVYLKIPNISTAHNFEFLQTCPIHKILSI